jgi:hypothetical protein
MPTMARKVNQSEHDDAEDLADAFRAARLYGETAATMITAVMASARLGFMLNIGANAGIVFRPSTADEIETAGVSTESARKAAPPSMAGIVSHAPYLRISEYSAKMPPSPLLSMRMAMSTYLTVVISVIDQNTSESMPSTAPRSILPKPP